MYSEKEKPVSTYNVWKIMINDTLSLGKTYPPSYNKSFVQIPLAFYKKIRENNNIDPTITFLKSKLGIHYNFIQPLESQLFNDTLETNYFFSWYKAYVQKVTGVPIENLSLSIHHVSYILNQQLRIDSTTLFEEWKN